MPLIYTIKKFDNTTSAVALQTDSLVTDWGMQLENWPKQERGKMEPKKNKRKSGLGQANTKVKDN